MGNIILILILLLGPFFGMALFSIAEPLRGHIAITCVFLFTGIGHFLRARPMSAMLPPKIPETWRLPIIYLSGVFEIVLAVGVLVDAWSKLAGVVLCVFLIGVLPANIGSAIRRVPFGGHGAGPVYLLARVPLQILLICWVWWFAVLHGR